MDSAYKARMDWNINAVVCGVLGLCLMYLGLLPIWEFSDSTATAMIEDAETVAPAVEMLVSGMLLFVVGVSLLQFAFEFRQFAKEVEHE